MLDDTVSAKSAELAIDAVLAISYLVGDEHGWMAKTTGKGVIGMGVMGYDFVGFNCMVSCCVHNMAISVYECRPRHAPDVLLLVSLSEGKIGSGDSGGFASAEADG